MLPFPTTLADLDAAMMFFDDSAGQRKPEASAISLGGEKRAENIVQISRRDTVAGVADATVANSPREPRSTTHRRLGLPLTELH